MQARRWDVAIFVRGEGDDRHAESLLHTPDGTDLSGCGHALRQPHYPPVPDVGEQLAVARSLTALAQRLFQAAFDEIHGITPAGVSRTSGE